jgi:hypothetical protein
MQLRLSRELSGSLQTPTDSCKSEAKRLASEESLGKLSAQQTHLWSQTRHKCCRREEGTTVCI